MVDAGNRVFGYENLLVTDGAAIPANPGVNPSLTITAKAEHAMSLIPAKDGAEPPGLLPEAARPAGRRGRVPGPAFGREFPGTRPRRPDYLAAEVGPVQPVQPASARRCATKSQFTTFQKASM